MFFLRCAFWLSVVYASMSWPHEAFVAGAPQAQVAAMTRMGTKSFASKAAAGIADICTRHRDECIAEAARLTTLVAAAEAPVRQSVKVASIGASRHRARDARLRVTP